MKEEAHPHAELFLNAGISDGVGRQHEVVVMKPDQGQRVLPSLSVPCLSNSSHRFKRSQAKLFVDGLVSEPGFSVENRPVRHAVKQRPKSSIAATVVVILENGSRLDGDRNDAVRLKSIRWSGETSRCALGNLLR